MERQDILVVIAVIILVLGGFALAHAETEPVAEPGSAGLATVEVEERATAETDEGAIATAEPTAEPTKLPALSASVADGYALDNYLPLEPFVVNFTQPMDMEQIEIPLIIEPSVAGSLAWLDGGTAVRFTPRDGFVPGQAYTVALDEGLLSAAGEPLPNAYSWEIQVVGAPEMIERTPAGRLFSTDRYPQFTLTFNQEMDAERVATALHSDPPTVLDLAWQDTTLLINVAEALEPGESYQFTLDATATDINGISLSEPYYWTYRLEGLESRPPTYPIPGIFDRPVTWYFNYPIDPATANVIVGPSASGELTWNADGTEFTYTFTELLDYNTRYTLALGEDVRDVNGDPITIAPVSFTAPPLVKSFSPNTVSEVSPISPVSILLNIPVDQASLEDAFSIEPAINGYLEWHDELLEFHPDQGYLNTDTTYTVSFAPTALDADGQPLWDEAYTWSFTTGTPNTVVNFGEGSRTQVVDATGPRTIEYSFGYDTAPTDITFAIFPYELEHWLADDTPHGHQLFAQWVEPATQRPANNHRPHIQQTTLPTEVEPGLYVLQMSQFGYVQDQLIVFVTNYGMVVQEDSERLMAWVTDFSGNPAGQQSVYLYDLEGNQLETGQTDDSGLVTFTRPDTNTQLLAVINGEMTAVRQTNDWRSRSADSETYSIVGQVYTDQPVYRPGETVNFRALFQQHVGESLRPVAGETISVTVYDNRDWESRTELVFTSSSFGTVNGNFVLDEDAQAGTYIMWAKIGYRSFTHEFMVERDVAPAGLTVTVSPLAPIFPLGNDAQIAVTVTDDNGNPVPEVTLKLDLFHNYNGYDCLGGSGFTGGWQALYGAETVYSRSDESGQFVYALPFDELQYDSHGTGHNNSMLHSRYAAMVTATLGDLSGANYGVFEMANATEEIIVPDSSKLQQVGVPFTALAHIKDLAGNPVADRTLEFHIEQDGVTVLDLGVVTTDAAGNIVREITLPSAGVYEFLLSGEDALANSYSASWVVYAYDSNVIEGDTPAFTMTTDKEQYAPGETAQVIIHTDFSGSALFSLERRTIQTTQLVQLTPPFTIVDVPITESTSSVLYASLTVWRPSTQDFDSLSDEYFASSLSDHKVDTMRTSIHTTNQPNSLNVEIIPHTTPVAGSEATFTLRVTDQNGVPVSAELSLAMADAGMFARYASHIDHFAEQLQSSLPAGVSSYHSFMPSRTFDYFGGCGCGGGFWGDPLNMYSPFQSDGAWFGSLVTDGNGEVVVTLTVPENPAGWRLTANAITQNGQAGQTQLTILDN